MKKRRRVILFGKSVILGAVGASLIHCPDLEILALSPPMPDVEVLEAMKPDVIFFDFDLGLPDTVFAILRNHSNLLLVGVNSENEQVNLWSSAEGRLTTTEDLRQLIIQSSVSQEGNST